MKKHCHLLGLDFESWIVSRTLNKENLSDAQLRKIDNGSTLKSLDFILKILKKYSQKITFFVTFKLERIYPGLIEKILSAGHEVGWHSFSHEYLLDENDLIEDLAKSKKILRQYSIRGFQSPNLFFFKEGYRLLKEAGLVYSSSTYGDSSKIYKFDGVYEIPVSLIGKKSRSERKEPYFITKMNLLSIIKLGLPIGSSYFWSILRERYYLKKLLEAEDKGEVLNLFLHNWQIVTPRQKYKSLKPDEQISIFRNPLIFPYRINVAKMFEFLLAKCRFQKINDYLDKKIKNK